MKIGRMDGVFLRSEEGDGVEGGTGKDERVEKTLREMKSEIGKEGR